MKTEIIDTCPQKWIFLFVFPLYLAWYSFNLCKYGIFTAYDKLIDSETENTEQLRKILVAHEFNALTALVLLLVYPIILTALSHIGTLYLFLASLTPNNFYF